MAFENVWEQGTAIVVTRTYTIDDLVGFADFILRSLCLVLNPKAGKIREC